MWMQLYRERHHNALDIVSLKREVNPSPFRQSARPANRQYKNGLRIAEGIKSFHVLLCSKGFLVPKNTQRHTQRNIRRVLREIHTDVHIKRNVVQCRLRGNVRNDGPEYDTQWDFVAFVFLYRFSGSRVPTLAGASLRCLLMFRFRASACFSSRRSVIAAFLGYNCFPFSPLVGDAVGYRAPLTKFVLHGAHSVI
ncbi:hypothetical protein ALPO108162_02140 [Alicyclobacillus pomorum]